MLARAASKTPLVFGPKVSRTQINMSNTRVYINDRCPPQWLICVTAIMASLPTVLANIKKKKKRPSH